jgi:hypothetical protein
VDTTRSAASVAFARTSGVSNTDLVFESCVVEEGNDFCTFFTVPLCVLKPINVTCLTVQAETCTFDPADLTTYMINDPEKCGPVNVTVGDGTFKNSNSYEIDYSFDRLLASTVSCTAEISCTSASNPTAAPVSTNAPTKKTSDTSAIYGGIASLFVVSVALL